MAQLNSAPDETIQERKKKANLGAYRKGHVIGRWQFEDKEGVWYGYCDRTGCEASLSVSTLSEEEFRWNVSESALFERCPYKKTP